MALSPISPNHTPELIDNHYLTGVHSTDSATTCAFLFYIYILEATSDDIAYILTKQLAEMQKSGILSPTDIYTNTMTVHPLTDPQQTTYLDDEHITHATNLTSEHLQDVPHAYTITTPTFSPTTHGLTLLASRQHRWTYNISEQHIQAWLPETLRKALLAQTPTITRKNVNMPTFAKDKCTIHCHEFQGLKANYAHNLFRASTILTLQTHITTVEHKHQNQTATGIDKLSQPTQALLQALDTVQPATSGKSTTK